jgi:hypothetical protein
MFRELPVEVVVQGRKWRVQEETPAQAKRKGSMASRGLYGLTMPRSRLVTIRYGLSPEMRDQTILHELLHVAYTATGDEHLGHTLEEHVVGLIELPLYEALKQILK